MPTYEYACRNCGEHLEIVQSFRDDPLTECPACGGDLRKVFGSVGIVFKGSGFYKTDSRSSGKVSTPVMPTTSSDSSTSSSSSSSSETSKSNGKSEKASKPAASPAASAAS